MKLRKILSGGQTGADQEALRQAMDHGIPTGGTAPKFWMTENGPDPALEDFGLVQSTSTDYKVRTRQNVKDAEATVWFGKTGSPGYRCTQTGCKDFKKPFIINPTPEEFRDLAERYDVLNIAGNRASKNPDVEGLVKVAFDALPRSCGFCKNCGADIPPKAGESTCLPACEPRYV